MIFTDLFKSIVLCLGAITLGVLLYTAHPRLDSQTPIGAITKCELANLKVDATKWLINKIYSNRIVDKIKFDKCKQLPMVLTSADLTLDEYRKLMATAVHPWYATVEHITPHYVPLYNLIILHVDNKVHSFVHELVHYLQLKYDYEGYPEEYFHGALYDHLEKEAVIYQRMWEKENMNGG